MGAEKDFSDLAAWFSKIGEEVQGLPEKQKAFRDGIIAGKTTGHPFKDWAIVMHGLNYKSALGAIRSLNAYLSDKEGQLFYVYKQKTYPDPSSESISDELGYTTYQEFVVLLSERGLVVKRNLGLEAKVISDKETENTRYGRIDQYFQSMESKKAQELPLIVRIDLKDKTLVYYNNGHMNQELRKDSVELEPYLIPAFEFQKGTPNGMISAFVEPYDSVLLLAGTKPVLKQLVNVHGNKYKTELMSAKTPEDIYKILNKKE